MRGRYAGARMSIYGAVLPGAACLARLPAEPTAEATRRLKVVQWCQRHQEGGGAGLEPRNRRPRRVRQPQTALAVVQRVHALREQYPRWGREKLRVLLVLSVPPASDSLCLGEWERAFIASSNDNG